MNHLLANMLAITIRGLHSFPLLSNSTTMSSDEDSNSDPMAAFLAPGLRNDVKSFVTNYYTVAKHSSHPKHSLLDQQIVITFGVNKENSSPHHESFAASVFDKDTLENHVIVVDRTVSNRSIINEDI